MPLQRGTTTKDDKQKGYYRWGDVGKKYLYTIGNTRSRKRAKRKAKRQGRAIEAARRHK